MWRGQFKKYNNMKKLILSIAILLSLTSFGQDSSKLKPSVTLKAKDLYYIKVFIGGQNKYEDLDSLIKTLCRPAVNCPANTSDVTLTVIENRVWLALCRQLSSDPIALHTNVFKRVSDALRLLTTQTWLIKRLDSDVQDIINAGDNQVNTGKILAKKEFVENF